MKHCQGLTLDTMNQNIVEKFSPLGRNNAQIGLMYTKTYIKTIEIRMSHRIFKSLVYLSFYNFLPRDRFIFNDAIRLLCYVVL